ncbi:MAG: DUF433 domain-containing protein [Planctomycetes bacterium]|nr:DUF433 domain-containing protein [Planctomycetota bacterium]
MAQDMIVSDPKVLAGKPVIQGTRISVSFVLQCMASGMSVDDLLRSYPHLTREGVLAAVDYAARVLEGDSILPLPR